MFENAPGSLVRGFALDGGSGNGVQADSCDGMAVEDCFIGTDATGAAGAGFDLHGVFPSDCADFTVARCLLSNLGGNGVFGSFCDRLRIAGCTVGLAADGTTALENGASGVFMQGCADAVIGGDTPADRNVIAENDDGINADACAGSADRGQLPRAEQGRLRRPRRRSVR
ncbi:MAG: hypothetical protein R3F11_20370 [Verrucomicrobiales bacterium]